MQRRTVGVVFICIAAFLYGARYISAAIYGSNTLSWNRYLFKEMLNYVGTGPLVLSILSLIVGAIYLIISEFGESLRGGIKQIESNWNEFDKQNDK
jgi:hypothetical protein